MVRASYYYHHHIIIITIIAIVIVIVIAIIIIIDVVETTPSNDLSYTLNYSCYEVRGKSVALVQRAELCSFASN